MVFDTPILDKDTREELMHDLNSLAIDSRYKRAIKFKEYLKKAWIDMGSKPSYFDFDTLVEDGNQTFLTVKRAIDSNGNS